MFQKQVNINQALGVPGDLASANAIISELGGPGAFVAGPDGIAVGRFAWIDGTTAGNTGMSTPDGFVGRFQQAVMLTFTDAYGMTIPAGKEVTIFNRGEFLAMNDGTAATVRGGAVYANSVDGRCSYGSSASDMAVSFHGSVAKNVIVNTATVSTNTVTASIAATTMTVTAILTGALSPGQQLTGTNVANGTKVVEQLTGATADGTGTYSVSISQTTDSTTITASGGCLTVATMTSGTILPGMTLTSASMLSDTVVLANVTGSGGAGKYWVSKSQTISSEAITGSGGTLTVSSIVSGDGAILPNAVFSGTSVTSGSYIIEGISGTGGTGTYWTSVSETVGAFTDGAITGSVDTGWKWASVAAAGEVGKISAWM